MDFFSAKQIYQLTRWRPLALAEDGDLCVLHFQSPLQITYINIRIFVLNYPPALPSRPRPS